MAKSEHLVKNHVQLQNVSYMPLHLFPQPSSVLPGQAGLGSLQSDLYVYFYSALEIFFLNHLAVPCVHMNEYMYWIKEKS